MRRRPVILRLECQVMATRQLSLRRFAVGRGNEQLIRPEIIFAGAAHGNLQHLQYRAIERQAGGQVAYDHLQMIDQATAMQFLGFHGHAPAQREPDL